MIKNFPMDLAVPFVFMFYATQFAQDIKFEEKYIEMHFSLEHIKMMKKKQTKLLKPIDSSFGNEQNKDGDPLLFQTVIDDNMFNSFTSAITTIEQ